jgi:hypothetical protein
MKGAFSPERSLAFFSHEPARSEASMLVWTILALMLVLGVLVIGGPS